MSNKENFPDKHSHKAMFVEKVERLFELAKRDEPETTGKFHEFLLDHFYKGYLSSTIMSGDLGQALGRIGELERQIENVHHTGEELDNTWRENKCSYCKGWGKTVKPGGKTRTVICSKCKGSGLI